MRAHGLRRVLTLAVAIALSVPARMRADDSPTASLPFRPYVEANGVIYVSGHLPFAPGSSALVQDDIRAQTQQVISNIETTLATAELELGQVVQVSVFLTDMADFTAFNAAYRARFEPPYPARTTVAVKELALGSRIEMAVIAVRGQARRAEP